MNFEPNLTKLRYKHLTGSLYALQATNDKTAASHLKLSSTELLKLTSDKNFIKVCDLHQSNAKNTIFGQCKRSSDVFIFSFDIDSTFVELFCLHGQKSHSKNELISLVTEFRLKYGTN